MPPASLPQAKQTCVNGAYLACVPAESLWLGWKCLFLGVGEPHPGHGVCSAQGLLLDAVAVPGSRGICPGAPPTGAADRRAAGRAGSPWAGDPQVLAAVGRSESGGYRRRDLSGVATLLADSSGLPSLQRSPPEQLEHVPQSGVLGWAPHSWQGNSLLQVSPLAGDSPRRELARPGTGGTAPPCPPGDWAIGSALVEEAARPGSAAPGQEMRPGGGASVSASFARGSPSGSHLPSRRGSDCH